MFSEQIRIDTGDGQLTAFLALSGRQTDRRPGVIVLHGLFGLNDDIRRIARRFAERGYAALAPDLYSLGGGLRPLRMRRAMQALSRGSGRAFDDIEAARRWLVEQPEVDPERMAVAGFGMGGGLAILHAARAPFSAVADFDGAVPDEVQTLAGICPVVGAYGRRDIVNGGHAERLRGHLTQLSVEHEIRVCPDDGHAFISRFGRLQPLADRFGLVSISRYEPSAEADWTRMLDFFQRQFARPTQRAN